MSIKRTGLAKSRKCVTCTRLHSTNGTNKCVSDVPLWWGILTNGGMLYMCGGRGYIENLCMVLSVLL